MQIEKRGGMLDPKDLDALEQTLGLDRTCPESVLEQGDLAQDEFWMHQAQKLAAYSEQINEVPVGAVVVQDSRLIAVGWNAPILLNDPTAHAEIRALKMAGQVLGNYRLPEVTLYVTLEPCPMCAGAMVHARVKRVVYGAADLKTGAADSCFQLLQHPQLNHRAEVTGGVLSEACSQQMSGFFQRRRAEKKRQKQSTLI
jgi:tRNA(adenine34) deaminase